MFGIVGYKEDMVGNYDLTHSIVSHVLVHSIVYNNNITDDYEDWLSRFDQEPEEEKCVYCGRLASSVDHVFNLVKDGMPTNYNTEKNNLFPCCTICNLKKGSKPWGVFIKNDYFKSFKGWEARAKKIN